MNDPRAADEPSPDMSSPESGRGPPPEAEPPPIAGAWSRLYVALVVALLLQCAFFAWLTEWAS